MVTHRVRFRAAVLATVAIGAALALSLVTGPASAQTKAAGPPGANIMSASGVTTLSGNPCTNGYACLYYVVDFGGAFWAECLASTCGTNWSPTNGYNRSAKNRMSNRPLRLGVNQGGGSYDVRHCMMPGQEVSNANAEVDSFKIGNTGGNCN